jgi:integrase
MSWLIKRPNQPGGVYYKGDRVNGKDKYTSLRTRDHNLALKMIGGAETRPEGEKPREGPLAVKIEAFLKSRADQKLSHKTIALYENAFMHFSKYVSTIEEAQNTTKMAEFVTYLDEKMAVATKGIILRHLKCFLRWAYIANKDTHRDLWKVLRTEKHKVKFEPLSEEEMGFIFAACPNDDFKRFMIVLYETGIRLDQVLSIRWIDIRRDGCLWVMPQKRQPERLIELTNKAIETLGPMPEGASPEDRVFIRWRSQSPIQQMFKRLRTRLFDAGKIRRRIWLHLVRHTRATDLVEKLDFTPYELRDYFGWSSVVMTDPYTHARRESIRKKLKGS